MTEEEAERLGKLFYFKDGSANPELAGKAAEDLARWAKIDVPAGTKVLSGRAEVCIGKQSVLERKTLPSSLLFHRG